MRKLLFILFFIPSLCFGQLNAPYGAKCGLAGDVIDDYEGVARDGTPNIGAFETVED